MRAFGFELISERSSSNKENNIERENENCKNLMFKAKSDEYLASLRKI